VPSPANWCRGNHRCRVAPTVVLRVMVGAFKSITTHEDIIAEEIVEELEAALEQFRLIAEDLGENS